MNRFWIFNNFTKAFTFLIVISFMSKTLAQLPFASRIVNFSNDDHKVMIQEGSNREERATIGQLLKNKNQKLIVPGNKKDLARLTFLGGGYSYDGLLLQAGPHSQRTDYTFPCILENGFITIGWWQDKNRACVDGIFLSSKNSNKNNTKQLQSSEVQEFQGVRIQPYQNAPILLEVENGDNQQQIKTIKGQVWLSTPDNPDGFLLQEGNKWNYDNETNQETIDKIDSEKILNSQNMQDFLNHENWFYNTKEISPNSPIYKHIQAYVKTNENNDNYNPTFKVIFPFPSIFGGSDRGREPKTPRDNNPYGNDNQR